MIFFMFLTSFFIRIGPDKVSLTADCLLDPLSGVKRNCFPIYIHLGPVNIFKFWDSYRGKFLVQEFLGIFGLYKASSIDRIA
ncbi:MAG: hypothetical protein A2252_09090 [Elusimicrobia bacterium RIFOXYA2_FULL_39_19]|nr:MAG: hypothetical protein A2252_09090 [Elusimicrobia bacterium RIFOXYA2_FULL_39_19]